MSLSLWQKFQPASHTFQCFVFPRCTQGQLSPVVWTSPEGRAGSREALVVSRLCQRWRMLFLAAVQDHFKKELNTVFNTFVACRIGCLGERCAGQRLTYLNLWRNRNIILLKKKKSCCRQCCVSFSFAQLSCNSQQGERGEEETWDSEIRKVSRASFQQASVTSATVEKLPGSRAASQEVAGLRLRAAVPQAAGLARQRWQRSLPSAFQPPVALL